MEQVTSFIEALNQIPILIGAWAGAILYLILAILPFMLLLGVNTKTVEKLADTTQRVSDFKLYVEMFINTMFAVLEFFVAVAVFSFFTNPVDGLATDSFQKFLVWKKIGVSTTTAPQASSELVFVSDFRSLLATFQDLFFYFFAFGVAVLALNVILTGYREVFYDEKQTQNQKSTLNKITESLIKIVVALFILAVAISAISLCLYLDPVQLFSKMSSILRL